MMGPDYTHWHGTYEVAKAFYSEYVPALRELAGKNLHAKDPKRATAAAALQKRIEEVLNSKDHRWYLGKLDPAEKARRAKAARDFRERYK